MWHQFTAATHRVLIYASGWTNHTDCDELEASSLLVGLLSEPECRAALMLAHCNIDIAAVCLHWPNLRQDTTPPKRGQEPKIKILSQEVELSLQLASQRLVVLSHPLELATEHILLGLAAADHDISAWLRQRGLDPDTLEAEILALSGYQPKPIEWEEEQTISNPYVAAGLAQSDVPDEPTPACPKTATLRVLDAAANRAREGLRVVEDYLRFVLDDRHLTELAKQLRHDLTNTLGQIPQEHRLASRETLADVGTVLTTSGEQNRADATRVLSANFGRLQESLRTLEEFGKLLDADLAAVFKQLRYRTYTLQRAADLTRSSIDRLATARLYILIDGQPSIEAFEHLTRSLIEAGADVIQLRDKQLADRVLLDRAHRLRALTQGTQTLFIMNDRPDLAVLSRADGVHVGQEELSIKDVRQIVGPEMLIGVSTHSLEQARQAVLDGANYIGVGPTFPSDTKSFEHFPGLELLYQVAAEIRLPAFAIGGINQRNVEESLSTGFTRIAVSGAVTAAADPAEIVRELQRKLKEHHGGTEKK